MQFGAHFVTLADPIDWACSRHHSKWPGTTIELTLHVCIVQHLPSKEPFHTLNHELLEPLTKTQCQHLDRALPKVELSALLGTLYEFIQTFIRHIDVDKTGRCVTIINCYKSMQSALISIVGESCLRNILLHNGSALAGCGFESQW